MSIRYKIALLFAVLVTILLSIVSIAVYYFSLKEREERFNIRLKNRAYSTARICAGIENNDFSLLRRIDAPKTATLTNKSITVLGYNDSAEYIFADNPGDALYLTPEQIEKIKTQEEFYFTHHSRRAVGIHHTDSTHNFIVAVAAMDPDGREYLNELKRILLTSLGLSVILTFVTGIVFANTLVQPMVRITNEVNLISSNNLAQRIKINETGDELSRLAQTFNNLLDRLQDSFAIQRRFISNASHELSTPLTSISSQLEVALQKPRSPEEYQEVMLSIYEDIKELQQLTRSLLDIAKTGSQGTLDLAEVRLDEVLLKAVGDIQRQNNQYKVRIDFEVIPQEENLMTVFGNANLLYIAFKNLIENGCKYSENKEAVITVSFLPNSIRVQIRNHGDVIAEADIENIFQPFFRADSAQFKPGFGLGLTLTRRILSLHKGTISVESAPYTGTLFQIELPNVLTFY